MTWTSLPLKPSLRALATLSLMIVLCPRSASLVSGTPPTVSGPSYWVASLTVRSTEYDKDEFKGHLKEFYKHVHDETLGRSILGRMDSKECYDAQGRKVPHCEVVTVEWKPEDQKLSLWIEESDDRVGLLDHYGCTKTDTFTVCFDNHMEFMAAKVRDHDTKCHTQGRECEINEDRAWVPSHK